MKKYREADKISFGQHVDAGGFIVRQPLPSSEIDQLDPFLLLHHAQTYIEKGGNPKHLGVGPHPHRGFSPVTFIYKGGVHHRDSRGNNSVVLAGGVQWTEAAMGLIHSERPPAELCEKGGDQELIQLWINTPSKNKMDQPSYQAITAEEIPALSSEDSLVNIEVVAGKFNNTSGPARSKVAVTALKLTFLKDGVFEGPFNENMNCCVYLLDGKLITGSTVIESKHLCSFKNNGDHVCLKALEDTRALFLAGEPINEAIVKQGPFVMNTTTEILEAIRDYKIGKMGVLIED